MCVHLQIQLQIGIIQIQIQRQIQTQTQIQIQLQIGISLRSMSTHVIKGTWQGHSVGRNWFFDHTLLCQPGQGGPAPA